MINIIGQILGTSGYDVHTRELANAICKKTKTKLSIGEVPEQLVHTLSDAEIKMLSMPDEEDQTNLIVTSPQFWKSNLSDKKNYVYLVWEGDRIPDYFIDECLDSRITKIIVPSEHTKKAIENTKWGNGQAQKAIKEKLVVAPHGVDTNKFYPMDKPSKKDKTVFIANKGFRNLEDRGGIQYLIKAYTQEFDDKDNVELIIKINPAYGIPDLQSMIAELAGRTDKLPSMRVEAQAVEHKELNNLYNQGHVFVSPTRAEAFNLPCLEAMACGLPVITTSFGGQAEYVDETCGWIVGGELTPVEHEITYEGHKWLTPDIKELRKALRQAHEATEEELSKKASKALEIANLYSWADTCDLILSEGEGVGG